MVVNNDEQGNEPVYWYKWEFIPSFLKKPPLWIPLMRIWDYWAQCKYIEFQVNFHETAGFNVSQEKKTKVNQKAPKPDRSVDTHESFRRATVRSSWSMRWAWCNGIKKRRATHRRVAQRMNWSSGRGWLWDNVSGSQFFKNTCKIQKQFTKHFPNNILPYKHSLRFFNGGNVNM